MPLHNLQSAALTPAQFAAARQHLHQLQAALSPLTSLLNANERSAMACYGNLRHQLLVNKVAQQHNSQPELSNPDVDWAAFAEDRESEARAVELLDSIRQLQRQLEDNLMLHRHDLAKAALSELAYCRFKQAYGGAGHNAKYDDLSQVYRIKGTGRPRKQQEEGNEGEK